MNINTGTGGYVNAPAGTTINFTILSGPGSLTPAFCITTDSSGSCSVTLNSATPGVTTVRASTTVLVSGQTLNRATGDGLAGDSADAVKTWVDANIQISPLTDTNEIGDPHVFTGHVNINTGTGGFVNAPAGTTINFSILSGPGSLTPASCTTIGTTGSCTVTLNSATAGRHRPSAPRPRSWSAARRSTGQPATARPATAPTRSRRGWMRTSRSPRSTDTNALGDPHVFTGHVNVNTGTGGYVNAPAGTTINFTIVSGPGSLTRRAARRSGRPARARSR